MRLADETKITLGGKAFTLRPTLRAAVRLHRDYNGLDNLYSVVANGGFTAALDLIGATCADPRLDIVLAYDSDEYPFIAEVFALREQLQAFVLTLSGQDDTDAKSAATGKPTTYDEYFARLFEVATGWIGWEPEAAWNATPAEILAAQKGRIALLRAVFGGKEGEDSEAVPHTELRDRLNALGDQTIHSMAQVP
jgi:hypothetical protein